MGKSKRVSLPAAEQEILDHLRVIVLRDADEVARCDQLLVEHHCLHDATLVGEHLRYAAVYRGQWLALASWSAAALHRRDRDQFIGWTHEHCRRRRALLANHARLLVLPGCQCPNLISRFMKLMLQRLPADWQERWDPPSGACLKRSTPRLWRQCTLEQLKALGMLRLKRKYWVIESRLHYCLDITLQEDLSRVRGSNSVRVLGMTRRLIVSVANAAVDRARKKNPKTKKNTKRFRKRFTSARGDRERLHAMIFATNPRLLDL